MTILFKRHFQIAYLVDEIDAGVAEFRDKYGIARWHIMDMVAMQGEAATARFIALAWTDDDLMIELIEPIDGVASIYSNWRKDSGQSARFHHLGFLVEDGEQFAAFKRKLEDAGCPVAVEGTAGDVLEYSYLDTTQALGHYYELIYLKGEGRTQFFGPVPHN